MRVTETISKSPIPTQKSVRGDEIRAITTCRAGKVVPVAFIPMLREDRVSSGSVTLKLDMKQTLHPLMNAINVVGMVHFIPHSAFERFNGLDSFNRSYQKQAEPGGATIPFFTTMNFNRAHEIWKTLGVHWKAGTPINASVVEAYNALVNFRRKARSEKIALRGILDTTLAEAFWHNPGMTHIVPDFDQAMLDGEVEMSFNRSVLPVQGIGFEAANPVGVTTSVKSRYWDTHAAVRDVVAGDNAAGRRIVVERYGPDPAGYVPNVRADLAGLGIRLSLSNIELAKKTASFAKMREQFSGLSDDHLVDLLMEGIRVPEEALKQPILLARESTIFGYSERHAMDGDNLDKSRTTGLTELTLRFRTPPMNTGGVILITVEIVPEQLFERQLDVYLAQHDPDRLPSFLRDYLDPQKVEVVENRYVDVEHATPAATFGYAPLNHAWKRSITRVGGRYYRPLVDTFIEDRQRFWSYEQLNPGLTSDFYLVRNLPHTVFADTTADPFEIVATGAAQIVGNTVFGPILDEDRGDYDAVADQVDHALIVQP